ncbi:aldo/keto reductase family protein [Solirubrobacter soli]|uniref:aldo/keto reductase family protein n=1 Tax=Solirubrobacter soli TaxID=363832 RepID=UPI00042739D4|nr:aldo/keto reductase family protein [Solirubrobacter soli]
MEKRELGDSGLKVTTVALGSWLTYSGGIGREQTEACTRAAFEAGITLFDTANVYGTGASERVWGEILTDYPRDEYVLATKVYFPMGPRDRGLSRKQILKQIDASLERLRTDYVDLYQCHRYDDNVPLQETMGALSEVVEAGKARHIGFSEWPAARIQEALDMPGVTKFVSSQPQYSALWRKPEAEVIPLCEANGISQIVWSPLAQGVLTGKYKPGEKVPTDSRAANRTMNRFIKQWLGDDVLTAVQSLQPIADEAGITLPQLSLAWVLHQPNITSVIIGASRPEQIHENLKAAAVKLSPDTIAAIDDTLRTAAVL